MGDPSEESGDRPSRPSGLPPAKSSRRRVSEPAEAASDVPAEQRGEAETGDLRSLRPPKERRKSEHPEGETPKRPPGLKNMTTSARLRLELALDHDDDEDEADEKAPKGLSPMTTSARRRLELALEHDEDLVDIRPPALPKERISHADLGAIPFDEEARAVIRSLMRWVAFCGLITLTLGALTGLSYFTGPGSIAHVVVGILACAVSVWLLAAAWSFRRVLHDRRQRHHLVHALGHIRSALLLKAVLVFAAMVLGCFTFSIAGSLLFLLG